MKSPIQTVLGADWHRLPRALQTHYAAAACVDRGYLDIDYPAWLQKPLNLLYLCGALINQTGSRLPTEVHKHMQQGRQYWQRRITLPGGVEKHFNSEWQPLANGEIEERVNGFLALRMRPSVHATGLQYAGTCYVLRLGRLKLLLPEWLLLGHTSIAETALGPDCFAMDFRLIHPWFGQLYRYAGIFHTATETG
ncbi:DUF4166 domain-containing protein [Aquitalea sp.]|uniref:DUF4166 domain-containing protein n=1 Tax=Aquitalea sp. TaxID=1872623 RepID=UPI00258AE542|nr:DUF4166 domain-containing protein [Aquitalea sp.]